MTSKAVVIEVGGDCYNAEEVIAHTGRVRYVCEFAIAVVAIEMIVRRRLRRLTERIRMDVIAQRPAVSHVEIRQPVIVVVEPDTARASTFEQRAQLARAEGVRKLDAGGGRGVFEADGHRGLVGGPG